jgi:hypothetical protein
MSATVAYDASSQRVLLVGNGKTWTWNGADWQEMAPANQPPGRLQTSMAFDPITRTVLLFGGLGGNLTTGRRPLADTWSWDGKNWSLLNPDSSPPVRARATMVAYSSAGQVLLIGGFATDSVLADAWVWNGRTWKSIPSFGPSIGSAAVDAGSQVIVFGGADAKGATDRVRTWNGALWSAD